MFIIKGIYWILKDVVIGDDSDFFVEELDVISNILLTIHRNIQSHIMANFGDSVNNLRITLMVVKLIIS